MYFTDCPVADAERYIEEQEIRIEKYPKCSECGRPIQEDYFYEINDYFYCGDCLDETYRKWTEDYID